MKGGLEYATAAQVVFKGRFQNKKEKLTLFYSLYGDQCADKESYDMDPITLSRTMFSQIL